jgi:hypothetical protein
VPRAEFAHHDVYSKDDGIDVFPWKSHTPEARALEPSLARAVQVLKDQLATPQDIAVIRGLEHNGWETQRSACFSFPRKASAAYGIVVMTEYLHRTMCKEPEDRFRHGRKQGYYALAEVCKELRRGRAALVSRGADVADALDVLDRYVEETAFRVAQEELRLGTVVTQRAAIHFLSLEFLPSQRALDVLQRYVENMGESGPDKYQDLAYADAISAISELSSRVMPRAAPRPTPGVVRPAPQVSTELDTEEVQAPPQSSTEATTALEPEEDPGLAAAAPGNTPELDTGGTPAPTPPDDATPPSLEEIRAAFVEKMIARLPSASPPVQAAIVGSLERAPTAELQGSVASLWAFYQANAEIEDDEAQFLVGRVIRLLSRCLRADPESAPGTAELLREEQLLLERLRKAAQDPSAKVRRAALGAMARVVETDCPPDYLRLLEAALDDEDEDVRAEAVSLYAAALSAQRRAGLR